MQECRPVGDYVLVFGRIYAAGAGSVADDPATFVWRLDAGRVVWGKVFRNREEALELVPGAWRWSRSHFAVGLPLALGTSSSE